MTIIAAVAGGVHGGESNTPLLTQDVMTWVTDVSLADAEEALVDSGLSRSDAAKIVEDSMNGLRGCWRDSYEALLGPIKDESVDPFAPEAIEKMKRKYYSDPDFRSGLDSCAFSVVAMAGLRVG